MIVKIRCKDKEGYTLMDAVVYVLDVLFQQGTSDDIKNYVIKHVHVDGCAEYIFENIEIDRRDVCHCVSVNNRVQQDTSREICQNQDNFKELFGFACHKAGVIL